jgi:carbon monoxide dehydrogenase subunit G
MSVVTATAHVSASPARVWEMVMDPFRLHEWVTIHRKLVYADEGPVRVGYRMDQLLHLRGINIEVHWELVDCTPETLAVWDGHGPARSRAQTEYKLSADGDGTRFDYRNDFHAPLGGLGAVVSRALVGGIPEREAQRTLHALCAHHERAAMLND